MEDEVGNRQDPAAVVTNCGRQQQGPANPDRHCHRNDLGEDDHDCGHTDTPYRGYSVLAVTPIGQATQAQMSSLSVVEAFDALEDRAGELDPAHGQASAAGADEVDLHDDGG
jgi:hypothetical protein